MSGLLLPHFVWRTQTEAITLVVKEGVPGWRGCTFNNHVEIGRREVVEPLM
jgi:hypothetical protein